MLGEWALSVMVQIFKGKCDIRNCWCYGAMKLLEYAMKVVKRMLEKRLCRIVTVNEIKFCFMFERNN